MKATKTNLIIGSTGKTGCRVVELLQKQGLPVRAGSRSGQPPFDWEDPRTWERAVEDVQGVYITFFPDLAFPGAAETVGAFAKMAVNKGVQKLVLLSGRGEERAERAERMIQDAGVEWTVIRASWFAQNFSEGHFVDGVRAGQIAFPAGSVLEPFIDVNDIAEIAAAALTNGKKHSGQLYEVTGPRLMTFDDAVGEIGRATGRVIEYVPVTAGDYRETLLQHGVPREMAEGLAELFPMLLDGRNSKITDGVELALGRPARDFSEFAREAAATGVWK